MKTLLIVDDEVEIAKALRRLLRREFKVELAHTGAEALNASSRGRLIWCCPTSGCRASMGLSC